MSNKAMFINQIRPHDIWQHYKGYQYRIIALSRDTETLTWYVVYEALYDNPESKVWHRPVDMFLETVEINGTPTPRFVRIEKNN